MSTFPTYSGPPIPKQLNQFNPRHWLMILNWIFFYPSRFKHYLYQIDPAFYSQVGYEKLKDCSNYPGYLALLKSGLVTMVIVNIFLYSVMILYSAVTDLFSLGLGFGLFIFSFIICAFLSFFVAILHSQFGVAAGIISSVIVGINASLIFGSIIIFSGIYSSTMILDLLFKPTSGLTVGISIGIFLIISFGVMYDLMLSFIVGIIFGLISYFAGAYWLGSGILIGVLQLPTFFIEVICAWLHYPLYSELGILKFPLALIAYSSKNPNYTLFSFRPLLANSFRDNEALYHLANELKKSNNPIGLIYTWIQSPEALEFAFEPLTSRDFERIPSLRQAILRNLGKSNYFANRIRLITNINKFTSRIGQWLLPTDISQDLAPLANLLLSLEELGDGGWIITLPTSLFKSQINSLATLRSFPHNEEIIDTLNLMENASQVNSVNDITMIFPILTNIRGKIADPLRPRVIEILEALADISRTTSDYQNMSNPVAQSATLNRASGLLNELSLYVEKINLCERVMFRAIIYHWQSIVSAEAGKIGERVLREMGARERRNLLDSGERQSSLWKKPILPFVNPYITGRPVSTPLFVGRNDILNQIADRWRTQKNTHQTPDSVILYGHRRIGKTSILQNLGNFAPVGSLLIYIDLAGALATAEQTSDLILEIAEKIYAVATNNSLGIPQPQISNFQHTKNADLEFQRLLKVVIEKIPDTAILILAFDEFEALERAIESGVFSRSAYRYLRMLSQTPRLTLILAGLHTLDEMSRDYQQAFYSSYHNIRVSYLSLSEAERLIARPTADFTLNYERSVIDEIYRLTYGQPLLIQSICSALVNHLNHELFDLELEREARILSSDLDAVLTDDFLRHEVRYFEGIWRDQLADYPDQQKLLHILAGQDEAMRTEQLIASSKLSIEQVDKALQSLKKRDVIVEENGTWRLLMPLFQRWLRLQIADSGATDTDKQ